MGAGTLIQGIDRSLDWIGDIRLDILGRFSWTCPTRLSGTAKRTLKAPSPVRLITGLCGPTKAPTSTILSPTIPAKGARTLVFAS
jgi:hypothetical protein